MDDNDINKFNNNQEIEQRSVVRRVMFVHMSHFEEHELL